TDQDLFIADVSEIEDAAVLKETTDDAPDGDRFREAGHTGSQHADGAHNQINLNACLRRFIERANNLCVGQTIDLGDNARSPTGTRVSRLALDEFEHPLAQIGGRNQQLTILFLPRVTRQEIE